MNNPLESLQNLYNFRNLDTCIDLDHPLFKIETKKLLTYRLTFRGVKVFAKRT
jgi:hypothetical protein